MKRQVWIAWFFMIFLVGLGVIDKLDPLVGGWFENLDVLA